MPPLLRDIHGVHHSRGLRRGTVFNSLPRGAHLILRWVIHVGVVQKVMNARQNLQKPLAALAVLQLAPRDILQRYL